MEIRLVRDDEELNGIALLQSQNLRKNLSQAKAKEAGFLTAEYELDYLKALHAAHPSIVAVADGKVVGYALVALKEVGKNHDLLADLIATVDRLKYNQTPLIDANYVLVGQLCVAEEYRGQGVVGKLYDCFRENLSNKFDYCLTDVAEENLRSLRAHLNCGFTVIDQLRYGGIEWNIILWDWTV